MSPKRITTRLIFFVITSALATTAFSASTVEELVGEYGKKRIAAFLLENGDGKLHVSTSSGVRSAHKPSAKFLTPSTIQIDMDRLGFTVEEVDAQLKAESSQSATQPADTPKRGTQVQREIAPAEPSTAAVAGTGLSYAQIMNVYAGRREISAAQYGDAWPFTVPNGVLMCKEPGAVTFATGGKVYAVNGTARSDSRIARSDNRYRDFKEIWKDDLESDIAKQIIELGDPPMKISIGPIIDDGLALCQ